MGSPSTHPDDGISKTQPLPKGTNIDPKESGRNTQLADKGQPKVLVTDQSGVNAKYQVDKTSPLDLRCQALTATKARVLLKWRQILLGSLKVSIM
ncbi:hypothetical protein Tco_1431828 [Tanacetum coccineum]